MSMKTVVVIGSNSFSGSHMTACLLRKGYRVVGVSRSALPAAAFLPFDENDCGEFTFHQFDLNRNLDEIMALVRLERPAFVINFAAQGMVAESWKRPGDWFTTNTLSQVLLHDQLRQCDFIEKYVHVSTPEVYGQISEKTGENTNYQPTTPYAVSRAAADMSLAAVHAAYAFPVVFTRAGNVYGPGQQLYRIIPRTMMAVLAGKPMRLNNGGRSRRSFIHIRDVAEATLAVMERGRAGEIYHIATERLRAIREVAALAAEAAGGRLDDVAESGPARLGRDSVYNLDSGKIRAELGWSDKISLEDGIADTADWVRNNLAFLQTQPLEYEHKT